MQEPVPTPVPVPLGALTADGALGLRVLAGLSGPGEQYVTSVHTSEMADPRPYLLGGELLLTAGVHRDGADASDAYWEGYARRAAEARAVALGFGVAPVHERVPAGLVRACERLGLPLLEVPRSTTFAAVAQAVWQAMAERRHHELRSLSAAQQTLAAAAARPHPVPAVLGELARHLGAWTVLFGPDGVERAGAGSPPGEEARAELASLARLLRPGPSSAAGTRDGHRLSVYGLGGRDRLALGVCAPPSDGEAAHGGAAGTAAVARVAVVLLALLTESRAAVSDARRSAALVRLMLGASPAEAAPLLDGAERWSVVHGARRGTPRTGGDGDDPFSLSELAAGLGTQLLDVDGAALRALVPEGAGTKAQPGWTLGVSAPVPASGLARADAEAARALRRAQAERRAVVRQGAGAGASGVAALVPREERQAHARTLLAPLDGHPVLAETVRMWLSLHGSWDRTAVALGVHRNTVRQRVARVGTLLDVDLAEPDVRMELWFALAWL
ncbi:PucR family transcriptional regulator ligand-binding domain-containing protein [Streptomyces sp. HNM0574]|uniref:PucR family transcriptional regulator ligand-binding domain-containing protein n=1 Tax=Streptomyces sp. HNM0574 TaxID=2714954 RepID=UPI00321648D7